MRRSPEEVKDFDQMPVGGVDIDLKPLPSISSVPARLATPTPPEVFVALKQLDGATGDPILPRPPFPRQ